MRKFGLFPQTIYINRTTVHEGDLVHGVRELDVGGGTTGKTFTGVFVGFAFGQPVFEEA